MRANEFVNENLSRRNFLRGAGAAAAAGALAGGYQVAKRLTTPKDEQPEIINKQFVPLSQNPELENFLYTKAKTAGIDGKELAQFMAQMKHESWNFTRLEEKPAGSKYFDKKYDPKYAPKTAKILGNTRIGDGERYKGRGFIQLTGRENYQRAGRALGIDLINNPELVAQPDVAAKIALWYWKSRVQPKVDDFEDTAKVTRQINPALKGLERRHDKFLQYDKII